VPVAEHLLPDGAEVVGAEFLGVRDDDGACAVVAVFVPDRVVELEGGSERRGLALFLAYPLQACWV